MGGNYRTNEDHRFEGAVVRQDGDDWVLTMKTGEKWRFAPFAGIPGLIRGGPPTFLVEMADAAGNVTHIARQPNGRITAIGSPQRNVTFTYGANGFVSEVQDSAGRRMRYTYTADDRIETITDAEGQVTAYTYRSQPQPQADAQHPDGITPEDRIALTTCQDEAALPLGQQIATITYPGYSQPTVNTYGSSGRVLKQVMYDGKVLEFAYKTVGACVANIANPGVKCSGPTCPTVDSLQTGQAGWRLYGGRVIGVVVKDGDSATLEQTFDATGRVLSETDAKGQTKTYRYDANHRLVQATDGLGRVWKHAYDERGNMILSIDPSGRKVEYTWDTKWNKMTSLTKYEADGTRRVWQYQYDPAHGQIIRRTNPTGKVTYYGYTPRGELAREGASEASAYRRHGYNTAGDLVSRLDAIGAETRYETDAIGRTVQVTDPLGYSSRTTYNGRDQVVQVTDALGQDTVFAYDDAGRLLSVTNPAGVVIERNRYDGAGNLAERTDALNRSETFEYDHLNRLVKATDRKGQSTRWEYNGAGELARTTWPDGVVEQREYDLLGRLREVREPAGSMVYTYDDLDRVTQVSHLTAAGRIDIQYAYNQFDRVVAKRIFLDGVVIEGSSYSWDNLDRLVGHRVRPAGFAGVDDQITLYGYNSANQLVSRTLPNGIRQLFAYDNAGRLAQIKYVKSDGSLIEQLDYTYDAAGRRTSKALLNSAGLEETPLDAEYDAANRMTRVTLHPNTANAKTYVLTYDDNGNLIKKENAADANDRTEYQWDTRNRLLVLTQANGVQASFSYDHGGRRLSKTITVNGASNTVQYVYEGAQALGEVRNGRLDVGLINGIGIDDAIARILSAEAAQDAAPQVRTLLTDALGSVLAQAKQDQGVENGYAYSPYGQTMQVGPEAGAAPNAVQYTGRENDGTGLYYYRARYYDPVLKRFISQDPIGLAGGHNVYAYVEGNPISKVDPDGLQAVMPTPAGPVPAPVMPASGGVILPPPGGYPPGIDYPFTPAPTTSREGVLPPKVPMPPKPDCETAFNICKSVGDSCTTFTQKMATYASCAIGYAICKKLFKD